MEHNNRKAEWGLSDLDNELYCTLGFNESVNKSVSEFISNLLNTERTAEQRFDSLMKLDKVLSGKNAPYRMPAITLIAGSAEFQAVAANGCGPQWLEDLLGIKFPDGSWGQCCVKHDKCYNKGGDPLDKLICDLKLYDCLTRHSYVIVAELYFLGVLVFGWFSHNWGGNDQPQPPQPDCSGNCTGTQIAYTNLRNFRLLIPKQNGFGWNVMPARITHDGRQRLEQEASRLEEVVMEQRCNVGCHCHWVSHGDWQRKETHIVVPTVDGVDRGTRWQCTATLWERELIGNCIV